MKRPAPAAILVLALLGISFAAPLVRLSAAPPLAIAAWRLAFSLAIIAPLVGFTGQWREWRTIRGPDLAVALVAGAMLALHFWSWNASLGLTSVAASVVLVNLQPAFVAALSTVWLRESPSRGQVAGIALALVGALVVASAAFAPGSLAGGPRALLGDALAVVGAVTATIYYVSGRRLRSRLGIWSYVGLVYASCLVVLLIIAAVLRVPLWPQPPREIAIFAALAIGPMMLGHTGMNYALRYQPAYLVNLTTLGEPVGATVLAAILPGIAEVPSLLTVAGGTLILAGMLVTSRRGTTRTTASPLE